MQRWRISMNPDLIIALVILIVSVVGTVLILLEANRRIRYRNAQFEYEKSLRDHPAGKRLQSEEDIPNVR